MVGSWLDWLANDWQALAPNQSLAYPPPMPGRQAHPSRTPLLRSLRGKVLLVALAVVITPLALGFAWGIAERQAESSLLERTSTAAGEVANLADPSSEAELSSVAARHRVHIRIVDREGLVADVNRQPPSDPLHDLSILLLGDDHAPTIATFDDGIGPVVYRPEVLRARESGVRVTGCRVSEGSKLLACHAAHPLPARGWVIHVQETDRRALRVLYDARYLMIRLALLLLPVLFGVAWWMTSRALRPVRALRDAAREKASSTRPEGPLPLPGRDEIGDLAESFNLLLEKLAERRRDHERFVADAAHELKNPVAAIRACGEALESGNPDDGRSARLARILRGSSARLELIVGELLELARAEAGLPDEDRDRVDLVALASGIVESAAASHPGVEFRVEGESEAQTRAVVSRLESSVRNLVDNAASFAGDGGNVEVRISKAPGAWVIRVRDDGSGIDPEVLPRVFDRFFTTRPDQQGTGLGLALARAVAEAHGGTLSVESAPGQGATFELRLPV